MSNNTNASPLKIVWHESAKAVYEAMWAQAMAGEGIPADEAEEVTFHADTVGGGAITLTKDQLIAAIEEQGMWGFVDTESRTIHAWAHPSADPADILHMLAHEIGHATGEPAADDLEEEKRADTFGVVASDAFRLLAMRPGFCVSGRQISAYQTD